MNERPLIFRDLSIKVEYALLALMELASVRTLGTPLAVNEITSRQPIPDRYLEHIFTLLRRGGIVQSQRGSKGGYILTREPWQITIAEVIASVEGDSGTSRRSSNENGRRAEVERELLQEIWQQADLASQEVLSRYTLQDLCQRRDVRKQKHPMYYI